MNKDAILSFDEVSFSHSRGKALNETSFKINRSETTVILGPNGAGKSILLKLCLGLIEPTRGNIAREETSLNYAMVFPKPTFLRRTVLQNMTYILGLKGIEKETQKQTAMEALREFAMEKFSDLPARSLSSGEKQRLSLIRALLLEPDILFLDEPTSNLDPKATRILEKMISDSHRKNMTIVMATHDLMQAKRIAQKIIFIEEGSVLEISSAEKFFDKPQSTEAQKFIEGRL